MVLRVVKQRVSGDGVTEVWLGCCFSVLGQEWYSAISIASWPGNQTTESLFIYFFHPDLKIWCLQRPLSPTFRITRFPRWLNGKQSACQCRKCKRRRFDPWVRKIPWKRKWQPTPIFLPEKSHGQRSLVGYSSWGPKESDIMTEHICTNHCLLILQWSFHIPWPIIKMNKLRQ